MSEATKFQYNGECHTLEEWADLYGITVSALRARIKRTGSLQVALETNAKRSKKRFERYGI